VTSASGNRQSRLFFPPEKGPCTPRNCLGGCLILVENRWMKTKTGNMSTKRGGRKKPWPWERRVDPSFPPQLKVGDPMGERVAQRNFSRGPGNRKDVAIINWNLCGVKKTTTFPPLIVDWGKDWGFFVPRKNFYQLAAWHLPGKTNFPG